MAEGLFDLGITGRDWVEETGERRRSASASCSYSKATAQPDPHRVAVAGDSPCRDGRGPAPGRAGLDRVPRAHPALLREPAASRPTSASRYGASEAKIPDIADCIVDITETGRALRAAGLRIIDTILVSLHRAHRQPGGLRRPRQAPRHGPAPARCSQGALEARGKVLVKLNVGAADLDAVIALLPSMKSPTVSKLFGDGGYAVETVVAKAHHQHAHSRRSRTPAPPTSWSSPLAKIVH